MRSCRGGKNREFIFTLLCLIFLCFHVACDNEFGLPKEFCQNVSEVEIRFRNYYTHYLSSQSYGTATNQSVNASVNAEIENYGLFAKAITESVKSCCPTVNVSFVLLEERQNGYPIAFLAQRDILHTRIGNYSISPNKFVFYFPEFSNKGATQVYEYARPFLPVLKSPGHAVVMLKSQAKFGLSPKDVLAPSLPLLILMFAAALVFGFVIWFLELWNNSEQFPRPFICGIFEGFWWAVVTMTTVGYGDKAPKSFMARLLAIIWMLSSYLLLSLIAANTTSIIATGHLSRIQRTIGYRIGTLNSKDFVEREMNLGAEIIDFNDSRTMFQALQDKEIDRLLFPHYIHFLMMAAKIDTIQSDFYVAKVLDQPFQVGLVLTHPVNIKSVPGQEYFSLCLNNLAQRRTKKAIANYSEIQTHHDFTLDLIDTTHIMLLAKIVIYLICGVLVMGLFWDIWSAVKKYTRKKSELKNNSLELQ